MKKLFWVLLSPFIIVGVILYELVELVELVIWIVTKIRNRPATRRARVEAELNRQQAELRLTILTLASQLGAEAHEARRALIRESFLAAQEQESGREWPGR